MLVRSIAVQLRSPSLAVVWPLLSGCAAAPPLDENKPGTCRVHQLALLPDRVPERYGLLRLRPSYVEAARTSFPNARSWSWGGCISSADSAAFSDVWYCPRCREAEREYRPPANEKW
jgi:hypothetical protein